jgi:ribosomal protein L37AE/L43A
MARRSQAPFTLENRSLGGIPIRLLIEHQCPQCGAPATLEETDRLFQCDFCKVKSYLTSEGVFHYVLPSTAPPDRHLVYFPYWRFKGMLFSCLPGEIDERFIDVSHQAIGSMHFPISVGFRSQALKLRFATTGTPGHFLTPILKFDQVVEMFTQRFSRELRKPILHQAQIGETVSIIYAPYYMKDNDRLYDAVLDEPAAASLAEALDLEAFAGGRSKFQLDFIATLCPHCGWDLEGRRDSLVLACRNCSRAWKARGKALKELKLAHLPAAEDAKVLYLPFWRIKADVSGIPLASYADMVRAANLPRVPQPQWEKIDFRFWGPAFKVRPQFYLRLATSVTLNQPVDKLTPQLPSAAHATHPVNLPLREAIETLKLNIASFLSPRERVSELLPQIEITPRKFLLVYLPFEERHHEYVHTGMNLAIHKNQLQLAHNL